MKIEKVTAEQLVKKINKTEVHKLEKRFEFKGAEKPRYHECWTQDNGLRVCE